MNMPSNSFDKEYIFRDFLGEQFRFYAPNTDTAMRSYRDILVQSSGYSIDEALNIIKCCNISDASGEVHKKCGTRYY